jgi:hypothetical protein
MPGHPGAAALLGGPHAGLAYGPHAAAAAAAVAAVAAGVSHGNSTVAGALTNPSMAPLGRFPVCARAAVREWSVVWVEYVCVFDDRVVKREKDE